MTVDVANPPPAYPAIASAGPFTTQNAYDSASDLIVTVEDENGITVLAAADYTVSPAGPAENGSVTLTATALLAHAGKTLRIDRSTAKQQGWLGAGVREKGLERQLDRNTLALQDLERSLARAPKLPLGEGDGSPLRMPLPVENQVLIATADGWKNGPTGEQIETAQASAVAAAASASIGKPYESLAAAQAAVIPAPVQVISVLNFGVVCNFTVTSGAGTLTTSDGRSWVPADRWTFDHAGMDPTGATDCQAKALAFIEAAGGQEIHARPGATYRMDSRLLPDVDFVTFVWNGARLDFSNVANTDADPGGVPMILFAGREDTPVSIASITQTQVDDAKTLVTVTTSTAHGLIEGDVDMIASEDPRDLGHDATNEKRGQMVTVREVLSATQFTIEEPLEQTLPTSPTLRKIHWRLGIKMKGMLFITGPGRRPLTAGLGGIDFTWCMRPSIEQLSTDRVDYQALVFDNCYEPESGPLHCVFDKKGASEAVQYGLTPKNGTTKGRFGFVSGTGGKHLADWTRNGAHGIGRHCIFEGIRAVQAWNAAFGMHGNAVDCLVKLIQADNCEFAMGIRAPGWRVDRLEARHCDKALLISENPFGWDIGLMYLEDCGYGMHATDDQFIGAVEAGNFRIGRTIAYRTKFNVIYADFRNLPVYTEVDAPVLAGSTTTSMVVGQFPVPWHNQAGAMTGAPLAFDPDGAGSAVEVRRIATHDVVDGKNVLTWTTPVGTAPLAGLATYTLRTVVKGLDFRNIDSHDCANADVAIYGNVVTPLIDNVYATSNTVNAAPVILIQGDADTYCEGATLRNIRRFNKGDVNVSPFSKGTRIDNTFVDRQNLEDWLAAGNQLVAEERVFVDGAELVGAAGATDLPALPGLVPARDAFDFSYFGVPVNDAGTDSQPRIEEAILYAIESGKRLYAKPGAYYLGTTVEAPPTADMQLFLGGAKFIALEGWAASNTPMFDFTSIAGENKTFEIFGGVFDAQNMPRGNLNSNDIMRVSVGSSTRQTLINGAFFYHGPDFREGKAGGDCGLFILGDNAKIDVRGQGAPDQVVYYTASSTPGADRGHTVEIKARGLRCNRVAAVKRGMEQIFGDIIARECVEGWSPVPATFPGSGFTYTADPSARAVQARVNAWRCQWPVKSAVEVGAQYQIIAMESGLYLPADADAAVYASGEAGSRFEGSVGCGGSITAHGFNEDLQAYRQGQGSWDPTKFRAIEFDEHDGNDENDDPVVTPAEYNDFRVHSNGLDRVVFEQGSCDNNLVRFSGSSYGVTAPNNNSIFERIRSSGAMDSGSAASPGSYFSSDTDTGIYLAGANELGIAAGGSAAVTFTSTRATFTAFPRPPSLTVAELPPASSPGNRAIAYVSDESGGAVLAFSDGTNWRRVTDRAVVS